MNRIHSFAPLAAPDARVLILGSMPGVVSLQKRQYYAHPRNLFWPILGELFGFGADLPYPERLQALQALRVALWDVLASCQRPGSLDASIDEETIRPNDFGDFFAVHPQIGAVFFNGCKAEQAFRRHVLPQLEPQAVQLQLLRLPSTSPAHASLSFAEKLRSWSAVRNCIVEADDPRIPRPVRPQTALSPGGRNF